MGRFVSHGRPILYVPRTAVGGGNILNMQIDLVYFDGCPHADVSRERLREALTQLQLAVPWNEWNTTTTLAPTRVRGYSSPTILINGRDVEQKSPVSGCGCSVSGGPSVERLKIALLEAAR